MMKRCAYCGVAYEGGKMYCDGCLAAGVHWWLIHHYTPKIEIKPTYNPNAMGEYVAHLTFTYNLPTDNDYTMPTIG